MPPRVEFLLETCLRDRRGVALPLALLGLLILTAVVIGFATLASTEPTIAANHLRVAQARAAAEAGIERAAWALGQAGPGGLADPLPSPVPAPYDGSQLVDVPLRGAAGAGFRVTVGPGAGPAERTVISTGWMPSDTAAVKARQRIAATLVRLRFPDPPAALTVGSALDVGGSVGVDARGDGSCGSRAGTWSADATTVHAPAEIWGADGNATANQGTDVVEHRPAPDLDRHAPTAAELATMRAYARAHGTYYQGRVAFDRDHPLPDGLVFVDTRSGAPASASTPDDDMASVEIRDRAAAGPGGVFRGWLVVNGSLQISGEFQMLGQIYAQGDLAYTGTGQLTGAAMSRNVKVAAGSRLDGGPGGGLLIRYDCGAARTGGGVIPQTWSIRPGSYRELPG